MNSDEVRARVQRALQAVRRGEFVVVADAADRENEGDLIARADCITRESMAFLLRYSSGLVCVAMTEERTARLGLPLMVAENSESHATAFTVSVDVKHGTSTGISASDRAATARALASPATRAHDLARPGHVFPLRARRGGVLQRPGHTEATVDLARLAGGPAVGVLCELVDDAGEMLRGPALVEFAQRHRLEFLTIAELIEYRRQRETPSFDAERGEASSAAPLHGRLVARVAAVETLEQQRVRALPQPVVRQRLVDADLCAARPLLSSERRS
jgi:3,4-dihydroxy-2-butanone 4-phosphate synthase